MENGDALYACIAELEKENEKLKEEKSVLMAVAAGNYKRGDEFKAICREYFTAEYIDSCVRAMDAALVSEYFRDTEDEDSEDEDENEDEDSDDEEDPDRCVKCDRTFNQRKLLNDYDCAKAWELHCDIGDDEGDLCCACLQKWEDERCYMCNSGEHFVPKEMMWPNHTDCVFCAEPEEYAEEKNISIKEAERISKDIVANSPNGWEY